MVSIPLLSLGAIGLLAAREATGTEGFVFGAYVALGILAAVGITVALDSTSGRVELADTTGPTTDDIERITAYNVAVPITAKSVIDRQTPPEPEPEPVVQRVEPKSAPAEPPPIAAPTVLSPSTEVFVNIGRRNKQLNRQMLTLISHLEQDELDPEVLHGLYELDHLATRMRRNEETLLLLASTRRVRQWSPPVTLENVLRSALAEVERFSRVEIDQVPDVEVLGEVVSDITHVLAELIDNATEFSHASTIVTVSAHTTLEGIEIEVLDAGHGIDQPKLDALNELLADPPSVNDAPSRRLGLFIAAQIAAAMPVEVALTGQRGVGTVATVAVDNALLVDIEDVEASDTNSLDELDALDLLDPVMQLAVGAELAPEDEEELANATLPSDEDVAVALGDPVFPTVGLVDEAPERALPTSDFPSIPSFELTHSPEPLPSRIPQAQFESVWGDASLSPMPPAEVVTQRSITNSDADFDEDAAHAAASGVGASIAAFTGGVARGLADAEDELSPLSPNGRGES